MEQQLSVLGINLAKQVFPGSDGRQCARVAVILSWCRKALLQPSRMLRVVMTIRGKPAERYLQSVSNSNNIRSINMLDLRQLKPQYVTNEAGEKTAVILPLEAFEELLEDIEDLAMIAERREEPTMAHDQLVAELKRDGLI